MALARRRTQVLRMTARMVSAPIANLNQFASMRDMTRPLSMTRIRVVPTMKPIIEPMPPVSAVPPITAAAIA